MSTLYDGNFATPLSNGPERVIYPFDGDTISLVRERDYLQLASYWERLPLDTEHPDQPGEYLVHETDPAPQGGGVVHWTRRYAAIPRPRREMESYAYQVPGIEADVAHEWLTITGVATAGGLHVCTTSVAHTMSPGDGIIVAYWCVDEGVSYDIVYSRQVLRQVLATPDTDEFTVAQIVDVGPPNLTNAVKNYYGREPYTRIVPSYLHYDYWLPGVTLGVTTFDDIPILQAERILDSSGNETDRYSATSSPTAAQYRARVAAGEWIVVEPSIIRRWMGNIYERETRHIRAI